MASPLMKVSAFLSWDKKIGELSFKQVELKESFVRDTSVLKTLDSIVAPLKLTSDIDLKKHTWRVHLVDGPEVNAFAIPSGDIVIYSGLIFRAKSVNEIQGVVAHEVAHVLLRHGIKNRGAQLGLMSIKDQNLQNKQQKQLIHYIRR